MKVPVIYSLQFVTLSGSLPNSLPLIYLNTYVPHFSASRFIPLVCGEFLSTETEYSVLAL